MHSDGHPAASEPTSSPADGTALASTPVTAPGSNPVLDYIHGPVGLRLPEREFVGFRERMQAQRDALVPALVDAGFDVHPAEGGCFVVADAAPLGVRDGAALCRRLPEAAGVAAIPMSAFHRNATGVESLVRFAFCKRPEVLAEAARRLRAADLASIQPANGERA